MAIKCMTKDGKVPVGLRMEPEDYELLRRYAFEMGTTPNKAIVQVFLDFHKSEASEASRT